MYIGLLNYDGGIVQCSQYLCPATLDCVPTPADCPCPDVQDVKCTIPNAGGDDEAMVICVRGSNECTEVERLMRRGMKKSKPTSK